VFRTLEGAPFLESAARAALAACYLLRLCVAGADFASYINAPEHWHITLFHTARLGDARPDAFAADGGVRTSLEGPAVSRNLTRIFAVSCYRLHGCWGDSAAGTAAQGAVSTARPPVDNSARCSSKRRVACWTALFEDHTCRALQTLNCALLVLTAIANVQRTGTAAAKRGGAGSRGGGIRGTGPEVPASHAAGVCTCHEICCNQWPAMGLATRPAVGKAHRHVCAAAPVFLRAKAMSANCSEKS